MGLPIDIGAVLQEAMHIEAAAETPIAVSIYIDETAPADLAAHVRASYASSRAQVRVNIGYVTDTLIGLRAEDDMAVLVAGQSSSMGRFAAELRAAGVPTMVVTTSPVQVGDIAHASGTPIPEGDLLAPVRPARKVQVAEGDLVVAEPIQLDAESLAHLNVRMGEWVISACRDKRLAFALAFPFVRRPLALDAVSNTALQNAGVGFVMFIPGADMPVMTLNQAKMLLQIAAAYGCPMNMERAKELALVVGGAFAFRGVARQLVAVVPGLGWAVKAAIGYAGTVAMGRAAIEYFEAGGDIAGLAGVVSKARDGAVEAAGRAAETPVGQEAIQAAKQALGKAVDHIRKPK